MSTKEDLILKLSALRSKRDGQGAEYERAVENYRQAQEKTATIRKALDTLLEQHAQAKKESDALKIDIDRQKVSAHRTEEEIAALTREVARLSDAEAKEEEYRKQVEFYREASLSATWRKENRDDGEGAEEYQIDGAIHLAVAKQAILGDKRGLGKTLTAAIYMDLQNSMKVIAVVPGDTMGNFIREIKRWTPHRNPIQLGRMEKIKRDMLLDTLATGAVPQYMLVLNYEAWRMDNTLLDRLIRLQADTFIMDEAHHGKDVSSLAGRGLQRIRFGMNHCPNCGSPEIKPRRAPNGKVISGQCVVCGHADDEKAFLSIENVLPMTGTPILNKPQELYPLLHMVLPEAFPSERAYLQDFCVQLPNRHWVWQPGGEREVMRRIGARFLARSRESTGVVIPPAAHIVHEIPMRDMEEYYPQQFKAYKQAQDYAQIVLDPDRKITMSMPDFIVVQMRLRQILAWPGSIELKYKDEDGNEIIAATLDVHESIKIDRMVKDIQEVVEEGERVVVFSQFTATLEVLKDRLGDRAVIYNGSTPHKLRDEIQLDFDQRTAPTSPKWDIVLANYQAASEGLNLNAASQMFIADERWNPGYMEQAYGRIDRRGQRRDTTIHTYRVLQSVDTWMAALIAEKADLINGFELSADVIRDMYQALRDGLM